MCFSSHTTVPTPAPRRSANADAGCSRYPSTVEVEHGAMVGGSQTSVSGSSANRLITSSAAAAFSAATVVRPYP